MITATDRKSGGSAIQPGYMVGAEFDLQRAQILPHLLSRAGGDQREHGRLAVRHPRQHDLVGGGSHLLRDGFQHCQACVAIWPEVLRRKSPVSARVSAAQQWRIGQQRDAPGTAVVQQVAVGRDLGGETCAGPGAQI